MRWFVRQREKRIVCGYNQYYYSKSCHSILKCLSYEVNFQFESSITYKIIETYINHRNQQEKIFEEEYTNQSQDYRDIKLDEKNGNITKKK